MNEPAHKRCGDTATLQRFVATSATLAIRMASLPGHERAERIWSEAGGNLAVAAVPARFFKAGYGSISIRSWKKRRCWTLALAMIERDATDVTDTATVRGSHLLAEPS